MIDWFRENWPIVVGSVVLFTLIGVMAAFAPRGHQRSSWDDDDDPMGISEPFNPAKPWYWNPGNPFSPTSPMNLINQ